VPKIKRWFPVSHDINADPEVLELTDRFGLAGLKVWLEILSIADRNEGVVAADQEALERSLSIKCNTIKRQVKSILKLIQSRLWIDCKHGVRVLNYPKYHKTRETNRVPSEPSEPSEPLKITQERDFVAKATKGNRVKLVKKGVENTEPAWKPISDRIYAVDRERFDRLIQWVEWVRFKRGFSDEQVKDALMGAEAAISEKGFTAWWPYLTRVIEKRTAKANGRSEEDRAAREKSAEAKWVRQQAWHKGV